LKGSKNFVRRRWVDFRLGHSVYLVFGLAFGNFILIFHRLFIERLGIELSLWQFFIIFVLAYLPLAVAIGVWHRKTQVKVETEMMLKQNPMMAKYIRILLDAIDNKLTDKEKQDYRDMLTDIEKGNL